MIYGSGVDDLVENLLPLSKTERRDEVLREWKWDGIRLTGGGHCICGEKITYEHWCYNRFTHHNVPIGSVCILRIDSTVSQVLLDGIHRIADNPDAAANQALIDLSYERGWINDWEHGFLENTKRKQSLSGKQRACRDKINNKILRELDRKWSEPAMPLPRPPAPTPARPPTYGVVDSSNVHGDLALEAPTFVQVSRDPRLAAPTAIDDQGRFWREYEDDVWCYECSKPYWTIYLGHPPSTE